MNLSPESFLLNAVHEMAGEFLNTLPPATPSSGKSKNRLIVFLWSKTKQRPYCLHLPPRIAGELVKQCSHPGGEFEVEYVINRAATAHPRTNLPRP